LFTQEPFCKLDPLFRSITSEISAWAVRSDVSAKAHCSHPKAWVCFLKTYTPRQQLPWKEITASHYVTFTQTTMPSLDNLCNFSHLMSLDATHFSKFMNLEMNLKF
jgi:hypothetical protein